MFSFFVHSAGIAVVYDEQLWPGIVEQLQDLETTMERDTIPVSAHSGRFSPYARRSAPFSRRVALSWRHAAFLCPHVALAITALLTIYIIYSDMYCTTLRHMCII